MFVVNQVYSQQHPQTNRYAPVQKYQNTTFSNSRYSGTSNTDEFTKHNSKRKWYKNPVVGVFATIPIAMLLFDGIFFRGKHIKSIFKSKTFFSEEEKALFNTAKENLKQSEQKVSHYEQEMKEIKAFIEQQEKTAKELLKDKYTETVGTVTYQKDIMGNYLVTDVGQNGFKFSIKGVLGLDSDCYGGKYQLERTSNGKLKDRIELKNTLSLEFGEMFARVVYDDSGKKLVEHANAAGGSIISEFENNKLVRQFEKTTDDLLKKRATKYRDMNGNDNITHSVEKNEDEIIINGKSYDKRSLGSKLWAWFEEFVLTAGL